MRNVIDLFRHYLTIISTIIAHQLLYTISVYNCFCLQFPFNLYARVHEHSGKNPHTGKNYQLSISFINLILNHSIICNPLNSKGVSFRYINPLMPSGSFNICCPRDCVSRHNGGTSVPPLNPSEAIVF